jgi:hypothetical protein
VGQGTAKSDLDAGGTQLPIADIADCQMPTKLEIGNMKLEIEPIHN